MTFYFGIAASKLYDFVNELIKRIIIILKIIGIMTKNGNRTPFACGLAGAGAGVPASMKGSDVA